jgi:hypothetical protein
MPMAHRVLLAGPDGQILTRSAYPALTTAGFSKETPGRRGGG